MRRLLLAVSTLALFAAAPRAGAQEIQRLPGEKPAAIATDTKTVTAKVVAIDLKKRTVTLEGADKKRVTLEVSRDVKNLDQVKKGDMVQAKYVESLAVTVESAKEAKHGRSAAASETVELAPKGEKPGGVATQTVELTAKVVEIDYKNRTVTLEGPKGGKRTLHVGDEVQRFDQVKKGDMVHVRYTQALAIEVTKPAK